MKYLFFSLFLAAIVTGCTCEEPAYIPPSGIPKIISPPLDGETTSEVFGILFSEPMNEQSVILGLNTTLTIDNEPATDSASLNWETNEELYIDFTSGTFNNCFPCTIEVVFHDKTELGGKIRSLDEEILDGDCDGVQGGIYKTTFLFQ